MWLFWVAVPPGFATETIRSLQCCMSASCDTLVKRSALVTAPSYKLPNSSPLLLHHTTPTQGQLPNSRTSPLKAVNESPMPVRAPSMAIKGPSMAAKDPSMAVYESKMAVKSHQCLWKLHQCLSKVHQWLSNVNQYQWRIHQWLSRVINACESCINGC